MDMGLNTDVCPRVHKKLTSWKNSGHRTRPRTCPEHVKLSKRRALALNNNENNVRAQLQSDYLVDKDYELIATPAIEGAPSTGPTTTSISQTQEPVSAPPPLEQGQLAAPPLALAVPPVMERGMSPPTVAPATASPAPLASPGRQMDKDTSTAQGGASALQRVIAERWAMLQGEEAAWAQECQWQHWICTDPARVESFKGEVLHPGLWLRVLVFLPGGAAHVQFIFAAATFFNMRGPPNLNLKVIGFIGNCTGS